MSLKPQQHDGRHARAAERGVTLLEVLVVLAIIGLVAALAGPPVLRYLSGARSDTAQAQARNLATSVELFRLDTGRYPTSDEGLNALMTAPPNAQRWRGPYLERESGLNDPWGNRFRYRMPGEHGPFDIYSLGADGTAGGEGEAADVGNW